MIHKSTRPEVEIPEIPLHQYVLNQRILKEHANKVALIDGATDFSLTYQQLHQMMFAISKNLVSKFGAQKGQVFGIMMPNHPLYAAFFHGAVAAGLTITTINPLYTETELRKQLLDSGARFLLTIPMFMDKVNHIMNQQQVEASSSSANENTRVEHVFLLTPQEPTTTTAATTTTTTTDDAVTVTLCAKEHLLCKPSDLEPLNIEFNPREDVVVLPYSSGTTGVSKGVQLTHYNLVANLIQIQSIESHYDHNLKLVGILPMFHIYGLTLILNKALEVGGTLVSMAKFDFVSFLTLVQKHRLNGLHIVPPIILAMAKHPIVAQFDLSSVQFIISGAAPLAPSLAAEMKNKFNITVKQGYGMTESSPVTCINPSDDNKHESSGALLSHTELKVVSVETGEALPISTPTEKFEGELCFRGPQVMKGYLNNEQATRETIDEEGWLHTGDIGYYEDGHVFITDRLKELIKFKGFQVPPAELEAILVNHDKIADAAVIGVPDDEAGELPKAFIVLVKASPTDNDNETDEEELKKEIYEYVAAKVAPYKKLRQIEFVNEIPKSAAGKILRRVLKEKELAKLSAAAQTH